MGPSVGVTTGNRKRHGDLDLVVQQVEPVRENGTELSEPPTEPRKPSVQVDQCGPAWLVTLHGEHDVSTRLTLRGELDRVREAGGPIIVDLSHAEFVDSTIISVLAVARQESAAGFVLVAPTNYRGTRLVEVIGIGSVVPMYPSRSAAIAALEE